MDHEGPGRGSWSTGDPQGLSDTQGPKCRPIQCPQGTGGEAWVQTRRRPGVPAKGSTGQWPGLSVPPWSPLPSPPLTSGFQEQLQDGCVAAPSGNVHHRTKQTHGSLTPQPPGSTSGALSLRGAPSLKGWEGIPGPGQAATRLGSGAVSAAPPSLPGTCHPS